MALNRTRVATLLGVLLGASLTSTMIVRTTQAVFTGSTSTNNTWASGGAEITSDGTGSAVFNSGTDGALVNGQTLTKCIVVTYKGATVPAAVKLYSSAVAGTGLADYLNVTVDVGSSTSVGGNCAGWALSSTPFTGTLTDFAAMNSFANGVGSWGPSVVNEKLTYRFTVTVQNVPAAQNKTASATFTWEAQTV
ncbi:hypothetical protein [Actinoplanes sp. NBRC 103695]|uniref:hypothetical protein n=1 Tax=Actinoplanes sp. NBRC 103695 TaxID=3032202 RepID=UPI0024A3F7C4|nr:hypothetical protein [Actinoplanes sp. NBRC 103695]GLY97719.1 hypothetical protein Acsp02_49730 [Actinoplanes sp. NBRC 103695]